MELLYKLGVGTVVGILGAVIVISIIYFIIKGGGSK